jgi:hypothetical protein
VPPRGVHEELQRVERAARLSGHDRPRLLLGLAHDDIALLERGAESRDVVLGQLVFVRQSLDVLLLDESALSGLLEQTVGGGEVVQVNGFVQFNVLSL